MVRVLPVLGLTLVSPPPAFWCDPLGVRHFVGFLFPFHLPRNSKSSDEVIAFVRQRLGKADVLSKICEDLCDACMAPEYPGYGEGGDNETAMIVLLKPRDQVATNQQSAPAEAEVPG